MARRIVQLATSSAPPLRSYVGPRAGLLDALRQWLPQRIFEQVRRRVFQIQHGEPEEARKAAGLSLRR